MSQFVPGKYVGPSLADVGRNNFVCYLLECELAVCVAPAARCGVVVVVVGCVVGYLYWLAGVLPRLPVLGYDQERDEPVDPGWPFGYDEGGSEAVFMVENEMELLTRRK